MENDNPTLKAQFMMAWERNIPMLERLPFNNSYLLGPFDNVDLVGWFTEYPPENNPGGPVDLKARYAGKTGEIQWRRVEAFDGFHHHPVVVSPAEEAVLHSVLYYSVEVSAPSRIAVLLSLECSGMVQAWVNGARVIAPGIPDNANHEDAAAWVTLKPGTNRVLVKMAFSESPEQQFALQVKSYGPLDEVIQKRKLLIDEAMNPGIRLSAKIVLAELLGTALEVAATHQALTAVRMDPCATYWDQAWVDAVERQYQTTGQFAPFHDAVVHYQPVRDVRPYPEFWPQSNPTEKELLVVDVSESAPQEEFALSVLQGLVNRSKPRMYLLHTRYAQQDRMWLDELHFEGYASQEISIHETWNRFKGEVKGAVIYDSSIMTEIGSFHSDQLNQTNVLMMICALEDAVPLTPEMNQALSLPVIFDARGKWSTQYEDRKSVV
jgi:hypothetical protein